MERDDFRQKLGRALKVLRKEAKISQEEIGEVMELHQAAVSRVECGKQGIYLEQLLMLVNCTYYDIEEILMEATEPEMRREKIKRDKCGSCKTGKLISECTESILICDNSDCDTNWDGSEDEAVARINAATEYDTSDQTPMPEEYYSHYGIKGED